MINDETAKMALNIIVMYYKQFDKLRDERDEYRGDDVNAMGRCE